MLALRVSLSIVVALLMTMAATTGAHALKVDVSVGSTTCNVVNDPNVLSKSLTGLCPNLGFSLAGTVTATEENPLTGTARKFTLSGVNFKNNATSGTATVTITMTHTFATAKLKAGLAWGGSFKRTALSPTRRAEGDATSFSGTAQCGNGSPVSIGATTYSIPVDTNTTNDFSTTCNTFPPTDPACPFGTVAAKSTSLASCNQSQTLKGTLSVTLKAQDTVTAAGSANMVSSDDDVIVNLALCEAQLFASVWPNDDLNPGSSGKAVLILYSIPNFIAGSQEACTFADPRGLDESATRFGEALLFQKPGIGDYPLPGESSGDGSDDAKLTFEIQKIPLSCGDTDKPLTSNVELCVMRRTEVKQRGQTIIVESPECHRTDISIDVPVDTSQWCSP